MKWEYWLELYLKRYCPARGLRPSSIASYQASLERFKLWVELRVGKDVGPDELTTTHIVDYIQHLRLERSNADAAVNTYVVTLRSFYRAMVAMEECEHKRNPTLALPKLKAPKRRIRDTLSHEEVARLLNAPPKNTILGLRDRAILALLYGTGARASEVAGLSDADVDLKDRTIRVVGKGGHQRVIPMNESVCEIMRVYKSARGSCARPDQPFFRSRKRRKLSTTRAVIFDRVKRYTRVARIAKHVSPHVLRHTFATHLVRLGEKLIVLRDLLGHKQLSSTQVYLHMTGEDLRHAVDRHPVGKLLDSLSGLLPKGGSKLPFQHPPGTRFAFNN
jgi:site-specific recombinase XerD